MCITKISPKMWMGNQMENKGRVQKSFHCRSIEVCNQSQFCNILKIQCNVFVFFHDLSLTYDGYLALTKCHCFSSQPCTVFLFFFIHYCCKSVQLWCIKNTCVRFSVWLTSFLLHIFCRSQWLRCSNFESWNSYPCSYQRFFWSN